MAKSKVSVDMTNLDLQNPMKVLGKNGFTAVDSIIRTNRGGHGGIAWTLVDKNGSAIVKFYASYSEMLDFLDDLLTVVVVAEARSKTADKKG